MITSLSANKIVARASGGVKLWRYCLPLRFPPSGKATPAPAEYFRYYVQILIQLNTRSQRRAPLSFRVVKSQIAESNDVASRKLLRLRNRIFRPIEVHTP